MTKSVKCSSAQRGRVVDAAGSVLIVELNINTSECGECAIAGSCGRKPSDKVAGYSKVRARVAEGVRIPAIGSEVDVRSAMGPAMSASLLLGLPLVVFIATAVIAYSLGASDLIAVISACLADLLTFGILMIRFRKRTLWTVVSDH